MKFEDDPNYTFVKKNLKEIATTSGFEFDDKFDWIDNPIILAKINSIPKGKEAKPAPQIEEIKQVKILKPQAITSAANVDSLHTLPSR